MNKLYALFLLSLILSAQSSAQTAIILSSNDVERLGIEFASISALGRESGSRFPGVVVTSPNASSKINSSFSGTLSAWHAIPGDTVEAGAAIATIRSADLLAQQNLWLQSNAAAKQANIELDRDRRLLSLGIVSQQRLEQAERRAEQAQIELAGNRSLLELAGFDEDSLDRLLRDRSNLGSYQIRAPGSGVLSHRSYNIGEVVASYSEVASLQQSDSVWLATEIPARLVHGLDSGFKLTLAGSGEALTVQQKDFVVDEHTQTAEVLAAFDTAARHMPGEILTVILPPTSGGVLVPASAVVHSGDARTVYVRTASGVQARDLELEPAGADYLALEGLSVGEDVVITGAAALKGMQLGLGQSE